MEFFIVVNLTRRIGKSHRLGAKLFTSKMKDLSQGKDKYFFI